jgi:hypothetical protein
MQKRWALKRQSSESFVIKELPQSLWFKSQITVFSIVLENVRLQNGKKHNCELKNVELPKVE